jgi:hypothetical protein
MAGPGLVLAAVGFAVLLAPPSVRALNRRLADGPTGRAK